MDQSWTWSLPRAKQLNSIFDVVYAVAVAIEIIHLICSYNLVWILFLFVSFSSFLFFPNVSEQFFSSEFNLHYDHSLVFFIRSVCLSFFMYVQQISNSSVRIRVCTRMYWFIEHNFYLVGDTFWFHFIMQYRRTHSMFIDLVFYIVNLQIWK